jgi:hypothetical protein
MSAKIDIAGQRFGRWTAQGRDEARSKDGARGFWSCKCDCGTEKSVAGSSLKSGSSRSCGCYDLELKRLRRGSDNPAFKHGATHTATFRIWQGMLVRCRDKDWKGYGKAGVTVCGRWRTSFAAFLADMGERPDGMSIDRIDSALGYSPSNCRWATGKEQSRNRPSMNRVVEYAGRRLTIAEWAEVTGISYSAIWQRLKGGWAADRALTVPPRGTKL